MFLPVCVQAWGLFSRCVPVRQESVSGVRWRRLRLSLWSSHLWKLQGVLQEGRCRWVRLLLKNPRVQAEQNYPSADLISYTHLLSHRAQWPDIVRASYLLSVNTHISLLWVRGMGIVEHSSSRTSLCLQVSRTTCAPAATTAPSTSWGGKTARRAA